MIKQHSNPAKMTYEQALPSQPVSVSAERLPFGKAVRRLFRHYWEVLIDPSLQFFLEGKEIASWSLVTVQLLVLMLLIAGSDLLVSQLKSTLTSQSFMFSQLSLVILRQIVNEIALSAILIIVPFLVAKLCRGTGKLREHCYTSLIVFTSMSIILAIAASAGVVTYIFVLYTVGLLGFSIKTIHNLSVGQAALAVVLAIAVLIPCFALGFVSLPHAL